jgi:DnaJ-class molecular chaperone
MKEKTCVACEGTGEDPVFGMKCLACDGKGKYIPQPPTQYPVNVDEAAKESAGKYLNKVGSHSRPDITEHDYIEGFKAGWQANKPPQNK